MSFLTFITIYGIRLAICIAVANWATKPEDHRKGWLWAYLAMVLITGFIQRRIFPEMTP